MPQIAVVILNWNGADDTLACLESLKGSSVPLHVIVVDNGSRDDSVARIRACGLADEILVTGSNLGYAEGNNTGLRRALERGFPVIAILNNDTVAESSTFARMLPHLPPGELRAVSPDIRYFDRPAESWFAGGVVDRGWPRHLQPDELDSGDPLRASECLSGCCIAARRETWEAVGLFDPGYFLIFEDSDWSLRAAHRGAGLYVVTASLLRHRVSSSFARGPSSLLASYYFVRNGLLFQARYCLLDLPRFVTRWLLRPAPALIRKRRVKELGFRWIGALAFALSVRGRAPQLLESLAGRLAAR